MKTFGTLLTILAVILLAGFAGCEDADLKAWVARLLIAAAMILVGCFLTTVGGRHADRKRR